MLIVDRDALLCDMAQTYQIYDFRAVPVTTLATLACGLEADSRITRKLLGHKYMPMGMLLAHVADRITLLSYQLFGKEGDERPAMLCDLLTGGKEPDGFGYASGEDFLMAWKQKTEDSTYG